MMEILLWLKLLLLILSSGICSCRDIEVSTPQGRIIGFDTLRTRDGREIFSFTGIPYAEPPVGYLRFKEAKPLDPWSEPINATRSAPFCPQIANPKNPHPQVMGQEDCLVLNVYSPKATKLPVIIFIHGGQYYMGGSALYGPELLLDKDVVLVTINYRLGVLGYLSTGDRAIPANLGLKDQVLAIKWVHDNIENFGGNPELITVFGESSGGASVHFHLLSPMSKGLIQRGIVMSGTADCPWTFMSPQLAKERTIALAVLLGCPSTPTGALVECMQAVPTQQMMEMGRRFQEWIFTPAIVWVPTYEPECENAFLPADPRTLESEIPLMLGVTSAEGGLFAPMFINSGEEYEKDLREFPRYLLPKLLYLWSEFPKDRVPEIIEQLIDFYFGQKRVDFRATTEIISLLSDRWFMSGIVGTAEKHKGEAYLFYYDYLHSDFRGNSTSAKKRIEGTVIHGDGLFDLFPLPSKIPNRTWSEDEDKVSRRTIDIWTHFARNGKPDQTNLDWEPMGQTSGTHKYLHITGGELSVEENLLADRVQFWQSMSKNQSSERSS
nr:PREDICTED: venom carboxylesterase-6-like [Bemisia tabaci]